MSVSKYCIYWLALANFLLWSFWSCKVVYIQISTNILLVTVWLVWLSVVFTDWLWLTDSFDRFDLVKLFTYKSLQTFYWSLSGCCDWVFTDWLWLTDSGCSNSLLDSGSGSHSIPGSSLLAPAGPDSGHHVDIGSWQSWPGGNTLTDSEHHFDTRSWQSWPGGNILTDSGHHVDTGSWQSWPGGNILTDSRHHVIR